MSGFSHKWVFVLLINLLLLLNLALPPAYAQSGQVETSADYVYGAEIRFKAELNSPAAIKKAQLFFQAGNSSDTRSGEAILADDGTFTYIHDLTADPIRAFSPIEFWFDLTLAGRENAHQPQEDHPL